MKTSIIVLLTIAVIVLAARLVHIENQRYALQVGMCPCGVSTASDSNCLNTVQTRTSWMWHLFYAFVHD
jgi:hypothetical protein